MEKQVLKIANADNIRKIRIGDSDNYFRVVTFIPLAVQFVLANRYLNAYFNSDEEHNLEMFGSRWDYLGAENELMLGIIDGMTDIQIIGENSEEAIDIDDLVSSGIWKSVKENISNYEDFVSSLNIMVQDAREEALSRRSVGYVVDRMAEKLSEFVGNLSKVDLSENGIKELLKSVSEINEKFAETPVGKLAQEVSKNEIR